MTAGQNPLTAVRAVIVHLWIDASQLIKFSFHLGWTIQLLMFVVDMGRWRQEGERTRAAVLWKRARNKHCLDILKPPPGF